MNYFKLRQEDDGSFFFAMDLGSDGTLRSVFWADGRSRCAYLQLCDVLVFDVTYKTNKFRMPFAPFTGVNQHLQSILFGGPLLEDETTEMFVWLFSQFRRCMFNRPPTAIIKDQDAAICKVARKNVCRLLLD